MKDKKYKGLTIYQTNSGPRYRAQVIINGETHKRSFKTPKEAYSWKNNVKEGYKKNQLYGEECKNYLTVNDLFDTFIGSKFRSREQTIKGYNSIYSIHIMPIAGKLAIRDFDSDVLEEIVRVVYGKELTVSTANQVITLVKNMFNYAVKNKFHYKNPVQFYEKGKMDKAKWKFWNTSEIEHFLNLIKDDWYYNVFKFAFNTGLRRGEICALKNSCLIDHQKRTLRFSETRLGSGSTNGLKGYQTRAIPLNEAAYMALITKPGIKVVEHGLAFYNKKYKPINPDNLSREFKRLQERHGIENKIRFHDIRHSFASNLAAKGVRIEVIQRLLGHTDMKTTQIYSHLSIDDIANDLNNVPD